MYPSAGLSTTSFSTVAPPAGTQTHFPFGPKPSFCGVTPNFSRAVRKFFSEYPASLPRRTISVWSTGPSLSTCSRKSIAPDVRPLAAAARASSAVIVTGYVLGQTHRIAMYTEIDIIAGSQSAVRRIAVYTETLPPAQIERSCPGIGKPSLFIFCKASQRLLPVSKHVRDQPSRVRPRLADLRTYRPRLFVEAIKIAVAPVMNCSLAGVAPRTREQVRP